MSIHCRVDNGMLSSNEETKSRPLYQWDATGGHYSKGSKKGTFPLLLFEKGDAVEVENSGYQRLGRVMGRKMWISSSTFGHSYVGRWRLSRVTTSNDHVPSISEHLQERIRNVFTAEK